MSTDQITPVEERAPTTTLMHSVTGHCCTDCGAPMASEQRYCVSCGARRGKPRFNAESLAGSASPAAEHRADISARTAARSSTATVLIASVGTLLLAMGVGVLIGHNGSPSAPQKAAAPQVITVGGSAAAPSSSASDGKANAAKHASKGTAKKAKTTVVHISPAVEKKAADAASKALGGGAPKEPTVGVGEKCNADTAGCKNGKFSGEFFGP